MNETNKIELNVGATRALLYVSADGIFISNIVPNAADGSLNGLWGDIGDTIEKKREADFDSLWHSLDETYPEDCTISGSIIEKIKDKLDKENICNEPSPTYFELPDGQKTISIELSDEEKNHLINWEGCIEDWPKDHDVGDSDFKLLLDIIRNLKEK